MTGRAIYVTAKDRERLLEVAARVDSRDRSDLSDLLRELDRAEIVSSEQVPPDVITMNSRVRLLDLESGVAREYTLVYPHDAEPEAGKVSIVAPIGAAMIGYREGDEIEWDLPGGPRQFRVEAVLYQPEAAGDTNL